MDFLAGRYCAAQAIQELDPACTFPVGIQSDGSPLWPAGIVGSITHTEGFISAAVAKTPGWISLGIDSESITVSRTQEAAQSIATPDEERRLIRPGDLSNESAVILIFSSKESVFKCLHPLVRRPFDSAAIRLTAIHFPEGSFEFRLTELLGQGFPIAYHGQGRFEISQGCVHTAVELAHPFNPCIKNESKANKCRMRRREELRIPSKGVFQLDGFDFLKSAPVARLPRKDGV